jgi:hypothetical protein
MATLEVINVGTVANDGTGDPLRVAFEKVNNNFSSLWYTNFNSTQAVTTGDDPNQLIFTIPTTEFTQGMFQINTSDQSNDDSQNITINATINNNKNAIKWVGHSTLFFGNVLTNYSMDIADGNVNLYVNPIANVQLSHWIVYQITNDPFVPGAILILDQNSNNALGTELLQPITTEGP